MKKSIFILLLICGIAFSNCKGQSEDEQRKIGNLKVNLVPIETQMPDTIHLSELNLTKRERITINVIKGKYFLQSQNSMKRIYEDSIANRAYLGLGESDTIFNVTFIFEEFPNWFVGNKNIPIVEKLKAIGMTETFNVKVAQRKKD